MALWQNRQPIKIFFSFASGARKDKTLFDDLCKQLIPYKQQGYIEEWYDSMISVGTNRQQAVNIHIYSADIIVFLISAEFLATEYYREVVLQEIFDRYEAGTVRVLSVMLRPISWLGPLLAKSPLLPPDGKPISGRSNKDWLLAEVAKEINKIAKELMNRISSRVFSSRPRELWNVPYRRNPLFIGRDDILDRIHNYFASNLPSHTHIQALNGLGGIGKTQIVVEYAYRWHQREYQAVFWIRAASRDLFNADVVALTELLDLPERDGADEGQLFRAIKRWLETHPEWLLVLDNLVDFTLLDLIIPAQCRGHVLVTTRQQATGALIHAVPVTPMTITDGALFLLRRAKRIAEQGLPEEAAQADYIHALALARIMDGFPLALDQAGAYIEETQNSPATYLMLYRQRRRHLLRMRGHISDDYHPESVFTTLSLVFDYVNRNHAEAMELLRLFAFLHPDPIADEMIMGGVSDLPPVLQTLVTDPLVFYDAIATLLSCSLIYRRADATTLSIHRIVQVVLKDALPLKEQREWAMCVVRLVNRAFPSANLDAWPICQRYLPQAQMCAELITEFSLTLDEAAQLLSNVGDYCYERALYAEAERYLFSAFSLREQTSGPEHIDTARSLNALALLDRQLGRYQQAELLLKRSLSIYEQVLGVDHPSTASVMNNLASVYRDQNNGALAEAFYLRALKVYEQSCETEVCETAKILNNLALLYHGQNKLALAESLYQRSLALHEAAFPLGHPDIAHTLNNLAVLYQDQDNFVQAEPLLQRALQMQEQILGPEHPDTALSLNNLAALYQDQNNYIQAEPLLLRALQIHEKIFGLEHPDTALSLNNLAVLYREKGHLDQAEALYLRALSIDKQVYGEMHSNMALTLHNLGKLYILQANYLKAVPLLQQAVTICEQIVEQDPCETALCMRNLAESYTHLHQYQQAKPLYISALTLYKNLFGDMHPDVALTIEKYTALLNAIQRADETTAHQHAEFPAKEGPPREDPEQEG
jgi:tetratricopeptide (TPR) repeat protein